MECNPAGDRDCADLINTMIVDEQKKPLPRRTASKDGKAKTSKGDEAKSPKSDKSKSRQEKQDSKPWELRELVVRQLRPLQKEMVTHKRSLRFLEGAKTMQNQPSQFSSGVCPICQGENQKLAILFCCGHIGCMDCFERASMQQCPSEGCDAQMRGTDILSLEQVQGCGGEDGTGSGAKLSKLVDLLKREVKPCERVIVFTQYANIEDEIFKVLKAAKVSCLQLKGTAHQKSGAVEKFQQVMDAKVLLLNVGDESASGMNLTIANHAIFVHPILAASQEQYTQWETQAIGRIRRYGQQKTCFIHRLVAENTVDQRIIEKRCAYRFHQ